MMRSIDVERDGPSPKATAPLGQILDFMQLLWALDHRLQRVSKGMRGRYGITGPQRLVIRLVGKFPDISAGHLARMLHVHPSTLTGVFRRLEAEKFLRRERDPKDSRRVLFRLTAKGRKINGLRQGTVEGVLRRSLPKIPDAELAATRKVLATLVQDLDGTRP